MNTIKSFLSIICLLGVMYAGAQDNNTVKPTEQKPKPIKMKVNKKKATLTPATTKAEKKEEAKPVEKQEAKAAPAGEKKDVPSGQTKMKSINRPVKVNKK